MTPMSQSVLDLLPSRGGGRGHSMGALCILHKAQVWTAYTLASTIFKSFKPEDLSWANFPFSLFFWKKKSTMQLYTLLGAYGEGE